MAGLAVKFEVLNQLNTPTLYADTLVNRPAPSIVGRIFFRTDSPYGIYRDTGTSWDLVASPDTTGITGSIATGQVGFGSGTDIISGSNNLFWDAANNRLGIGTATPGTKLDIHGTGTIAQLNGTGTNNSYLMFQNAGTNEWRIGNNYDSGTNYFSIYDSSNSIESIKLTQSATLLNTIVSGPSYLQMNTTETNIGATTVINNQSFATSNTYNAGITRDGQTDFGCFIRQNNIYSGALTWGNTGNRANLFLNLQFQVNGTVSQTGTGYILAYSCCNATTRPSGTGTFAQLSTYTAAPDLGGTSVTITNRYQLLINNLSGFGANSPIYTNRWAIYQEGTSDNNYFAGKVLIGTTTVGTHLLDIVGSMRASTSGNTITATFLNTGNTSTALFQNTSSQTSLIEIKSTTTSASQVRLTSTTSDYGWCVTQQSGHFFIGSQPDVGNPNKIIVLNRTNANVLIQSSTTTNFAAASAQLQIDSTTKGFLPPRMTTTEKNAIATPANGLVVYDTTLAKLCVYTGSAWQTITSA